MMKCVLFALAAACFLSIAVATAPLLAMDSDSRVPDQYLVVFHRDSSVDIRDKHVDELTARLTGDEKIIRKFDIGKFIGYAAVLSKDTLASELEHPNVRYIEADQEVHLTDTTASQSGATWGINRVSQTNLPLTGTYRYWASGGATVQVYIIDTGIMTTHNEFSGGRAVWGVNMISGEGLTDGNGHGTHVASTVGGRTYGIAKLVKLVAVKVLSAAGSGTNAGVIGGVDWSAKNHVSRGAKALSVANMSLGGGIAIALDEAVDEAIALGIHFVLAAGNSNADACNSSPARVVNAVTVGATTNTDARASYSNYGRCLDIFCPGSSITGAGIASVSSTSVLSGTSMASPHVAGILAMYLGHQYNISAPTYPSPSVLVNWLVTVSTKNVVTSPGTNSPNRLCYSPSQ